ncbi:MAG: response regulator [Deltaproteobacteria bacterium]|jgi:two-component system chemotaxis response regulator CheY|nr:response regulator [Deltaproteobacteria bacterium]
MSNIKSGAWKKLKIMVVEDDKTTRVLLRKMLEEFGEVQTVDNGSDAIELFRKSLASPEKFDLLCLDIGLPGVSGHEVLESIREEEKQFGYEGIFRVKVIMTTASKGEEDVLGAFRKKCDAYLVKPVTKEKLIQRMEELNLISKSNLPV